MLAFDVFTNETFSAVELTEAVGDMYYIPQTINQMNLFDVEAIRTTEVGIYKKNESLQLVPTTERGSEPIFPGRDTRSIKKLPTLGIRQRDRINSHELQNLFNDNMPFEAALANAESEVEKRQRKLMRQLELTREYHRFAAMRGFVLDADQSIILNLFDEFGVSQPSPIAFDFTALDEGELRIYIQNQVLRPLMRQAGGRWTPNTRIGALCGDEFYDKLTTAPEIREAYLTSLRGMELLEPKVWDEFRFANVTWMNFRGTNNTDIRIADDECQFFLIGAQDVFKEYRAPGEDMSDANTLGKEMYSWVSPDYRPNMMHWVDVYLSAFPIWLCISPDLLLSGELD